MPARAETAKVFATAVLSVLAQTPLPTQWGVWDREFVTTRLGDGWEANDILAHVAAEAS